MKGRAVIGVHILPMTRATVKWNDERAVCSTGCSTECVARLFSMWAVRCDSCCETSIWRPLMTDSYSAFISDSRASSSAMVCVQPRSGLPQRSHTYLGHVSSMIQLILMGCSKSLRSLRDIVGWNKYLCGCYHTAEIVFGLPSKLLQQHSHALHSDYYRHSAPV